MNAKVILEKNSHCTTKGIIIQKHLEQIGEDLILEMFARESI